MTTIVPPRCSASSRRTRSTTTAPSTTSIGAVEPGERFEVESVEGFGNAFQTPEDWTPESYAVAEKLKWAVVGPIDVAGAKAGGAVAVTIESVEVTTPGVCVYGPYTAEDPYTLVGRGGRVRDLRLERRLRPLRRAHDAAVAAADRLPRRAARRRVAAREPAGPLRREHGLQGHRRRRDARAPGRARRRRPLLRRLQAAARRRRDHRPARGRRARDRDGRAARAPARR